MLLEEADPLGNDDDAESDASSACSSLFGAAFAEEMKERKRKEQVKKDDSVNLLSPLVAPNPEVSPRTECQRFKKASVVSLTFDGENQSRPPSRPRSSRTPKLSEVVQKKFSMSKGKAVLMMLTHAKSSETKLESKVDALRSKVTSLEQQLHDEQETHEAEVSKLQKHIYIIERNIVSLQSETPESRPSENGRDEAVSLRRKLAEQSKKQAENQIEIRKLHNLLCRAEKTEKEKDVIIAQLQQGSSNVFDDKLKQLETHLYEEEKRTKELAQTIEEQNIEMDKLKSRNAKKESSMKAAHMLAINGARAELQNLRQTTAKNEKTIEKFEKRLGQMTADLGKATDEKRELMAQLNQAREQNEANKIPPPAEEPEEPEELNEPKEPEELNELRDKVEELSEDLTTTKTALSLLETELDVARKDLVQSQKETTAAKEAVSKMVDEQLQKSPNKDLSLEVLTYIKEISSLIPGMQSVINRDFFPTNGYAFMHLSPTMAMDVAGAVTELAEVLEDVGKMFCTELASNQAHQSTIASMKEEIKKISEEKQKVVKTMQVQKNVPHPQKEITEQEKVEEIKEEIEEEVKEVETIEKKCYTVVTRMLEWQKKLTALWNEKREACRQKYRENLTRLIVQMQLPLMSDDDPFRTSGIVPQKRERVGSPVSQFPRPEYCEQMPAQSALPPDLMNESTQLPKQCASPQSAPNEHSRGWMRFMQCPLCGRSEQRNTVQKDMHNYEVTSSHQFAASPALSGVKNAPRERPPVRSNHSPVVAKEKQLPKIIQGESSHHLTGVVTNMKKSGEQNRKEKDVPKTTFAKPERSERCIVSRSGRKRQFKQRDSLLERIIANHEQSGLMEMGNDSLPPLPAVERHPQETSAVSKHELHALMTSLSHSKIEKQPITHKKIVTNNRPARDLRTHLARAEEAVQEMHT